MASKAVGCRPWRPLGRVRALTPERTPPHSFEFGAGAAVVGRRMKPSQDLIEKSRVSLQAFGYVKYGTAFTDALMVRPMGLLRVMAEDAIHDDWPDAEIVLLRQLLKTFRAAE